MPIEPKEIRSIRCGECGEIRIPTPSGSVCPNGHGKIHPKITARLKRMAADWDWAKTLPEATAKTHGGRRYTVNGLDGDWKIVEFNSRFFSYEASRRVPRESEARNDCIIAQVRGVARQMKRVR